MEKFIFIIEPNGIFLNSIGGGAILRASELVGKEVIDITTGDRLGMIQKSELMVNLETGMVEALVLIQHGWSGREKEVRSIPWGEIRKISEELIIIAGENAESNL